MLDQFVASEAGESGGLSWTGERYIPSLTGVIELEHVHRYLMAKQLAGDKDVLDIASGEGYGSAMLAEVARSVIGVDNSEEAIAHAERTYLRENLKFRLGSCEAIPLADAAVDLVVSFETIEHHDQHQAMIREIRRVLRPGGVLVVSSPDRYEYSVVTGYRNPYHVKELYRGEFEQLLAGYFRHVVYLGQRVVSGSAIFHSHGNGPMVSFRREDHEIVSSEGIPRPVYLIGIASDAEPPDLPHGFFVQTLGQTEGTTEREFAALRSELSRIAAECDVWKTECVNSRRTLEELQQSISWRLTRPVRWISGWATAPRRQFGRLVRSVYRALPLSMESKLKLKAHVFSHFGRWLGSFQSYRSWLDHECGKQEANSAADSGNPRFGRQ